MSKSLPTTVAGELKCSICTKYLSVSPVTLCSTMGVVCGRCSGRVPGFPQLHVYETLAKLFKFPCSYQGCTEVVPWDSVSAHETSCKHKLYDCPSQPLNACYWKGSREQMREHFAQEHKELVLNWSYFHLPRKHSGQVNKLMVLKDATFVLQTSLESDLQTCWLGLLYVGDEADVKHNFSIVLRSDANNVVLKKKKIFAADTFTCNYANMIPLKIDNLKVMLESSDILCKLELEEIVPDKSKKQPETPPSNSNSVTNDNQLLRELECPICNEYMSAPIYICGTGHSLCGKCKCLVQTCPQCKTVLLDTRNYTLEKLSELMQYPCRNDMSGCTFVGYLSALRAHEKQCLVNVPCPIEPCKFKSAPGSMLTHVKMFHPENTMVELNQYMFRNLESKVLVDTHVVMCGSDTFKICCKHSAVKGPVRWAVQPLDGKARDEPKFKFELEFLDQTGLGRKLVVNDLCRVASNSVKDGFASCLQLPYALLEPFITAEKKLIFKIDIQKVQGA